MVMVDVAAEALVGCSDGGFGLGSVAVVHYPLNSILFVWFVSERFFSNGTNVCVRGGYRVGVF